MLEPEKSLKWPCDSFNWECIIDCGQKDLYKARVEFFSQ
jgi:hypothetical protein